MITNNARGFNGMRGFRAVTNYAVDKGGATISLKRPKAMNAISQTMRKELKQLIDTVEANDDGERVRR